ncbi:Pectinacetylesterase family protein [Heracleum sosnowskyi]|uniref:Pectinacetylesterase family protein n=1 Tax=Heracleum sosnowskyi TaxID=360622 RepID=A0AAD8MU53_9APIA|nr:Pectinacetylesterase family protein [Heracleum sosnowskyi]
MATWEDDQIVEDQYEDHQESQFQTHGLSRLATCTSSSTLDYENFDNIDDDNHGTISTMLSRLSIESFDVGGDDDQEFSDGVYGPDGQENSSRGCLFLNSDDDKEPPTPVWYSLPATPLHEQRCQTDDLSKQYLSDYNCGKLCRRKKKVLRRKKWEERKTSKSDEEEDEDSVERNMNLSLLSQNSFSGESEGGLRVITRPKGGKRALCMDMEEVKACRDLGFELEHQQMYDLTGTPSRLTLSPSTLDTTTTSSGGSSPIPNWRVSSPGDTPKDVKARLKVWAQAVALASSSSWRHLTSS